MTSTSLDTLDFRETTGAGTRVPTDEDFENCGGGCGGTIPVRKNMPVDEQFFYVDGAGVYLCPECRRSIYGPLRGELASGLMELQDTGILV